MAVYAIFTRGRNRIMHAAREGATQTLCQHPIGRGTGLVRDGNYTGSKPCPRCWPRSRA